MKACIRLSPHLEFNSLNIYQTNIFPPKIVEKMEQIFYVPYTSSLSLPASGPHPKSDKSTPQTHTGFKITFNIVTCMSDYRRGLDW
jgi:hypothetical protein